MKLRLSASLLCALLACAGQAWATTLPDSCGADKVKFNVKTEKGKPAPAGPADGKAEIIFAENDSQMIAPFSYATVRFGMDGAWVGANNGNSYFALTVDPGVHHLCADWQSVLGPFKKKIAVTSFTAEPGQVYYFAAQVTVVSRELVTFDLSQLNDDAGKFRVKAWKLSTWTSK